MHDPGVCVEEMFKQIIERVEDLQVQTAVGSDIFHLVPPMEISKKRNETGCRFQHSPKEQRIASAIEWVYNWFYHSLLKCSMSLRCNNHVCCALHPVFPQITLNFEMIWVGLLTLQGDARNCPTQQREAEGGLLGVPHVWSWTRSQCHALSFRKEYVLIKHLAYGAKTIPFLEKNTTVIPIRSEIWRAFPNSRPLHPAELVLKWWILPSIYIQV